LAIAGNTSNQIQFKWKLIVLRDFFIQVNTALRNYHDTLYMLLVCLYCLFFLLIFIPVIDINVIAVAVFMFMLAIVSVSLCTSGRVVGNYLSKTIGSTVVIDISTVTTLYGGLNYKIFIQAKLIVLNALVPEDFSPLIRDRVHNVFTTR
jgi:hypothetical protein